MKSRLILFLVLACPLAAFAQRYDGPDDEAGRALRAIRERGEREAQQRANDARIRRANAAASNAQTSADDAIRAAEQAARTASAEVAALRREMAQAEAGRRAGEAAAMAAAEKAARDERVRKIADEMMAEREKLAADPVEQQRRAFVAALRASEERALAKYPVLNHVDSPHRRAFMAYIDEQEALPERAAFFQTSDWPELIANEYASKFPVPRKVSYSMRKRADGSVLILSADGERLLFTTQAEADQFIAEAKNTPTATP
jgi:hypothetical protein